MLFDYIFEFIVSKFSAFLAAENYFSDHIVSKLMVLLVLVILLIDLIDNLVKLFLILLIASIVLLVLHYLRCNMARNSYHKFDDSLHRALAATYLLLLFLHYIFLLIRHKVKQCLLLEFGHRIVAVEDEECDNSHEIVSIWMLLNPEELFRVEKFLQFGTFLIKIKILDEARTINDSLQHLILVLNGLVWRLECLILDLLDNLH